MNNKLLALVTDLQTVQKCVRVIAHAAPATSSTADPAAAAAPPAAPPAPALPHVNNMLRRALQRTTLDAAASLLSSDAADLGKRARTEEGQA